MDLRSCSDIQEAIKLSKEWQFPLLVFVHEKPKEGTSDVATSVNAIPGLYETLPNGQKRLCMSFELSAPSLAGDGSAQQLALETVLKESRLGLVTFLHFLESGSPAHEQFTTAVTDSSGIVPRLHFFPPSQRDLAPAVIHGNLLNPVKICEMIRVALQMPTLAKIPDAQREFMGELDLMNAAARQQHESRIGALGGMSSPHFSSPSAESVTKPQHPGESACPRPAGLHLIALHGLEKKKVILTSPGMTLRTIWQQASQSLEREAAAASAEGIPCRGKRFELCVESQPAEITARSVEEASKMNIHELPHNTVVRVVILDGDASGGGTPAASLASSKPSRRPSDAMISQSKKREGREEVGDTHKPRVRCDGDSCRLEAPRTESTSGAEPQSQSVSQSHLHSETKAGGGTLITIRCLLPDGETHVVSGLDPSTATFAANLRGPVEAALGHDKFLFAQPYPLRRYTAEEEASPLRSLGIGSSSAVRVMLTGASAAHTTPSTAQSSHHDGSRGLFGIVSNILSQVRGGAPSTGSAPAASQPTGTNTNTSVQANRTAGGGRIRTMAEIRAAEEEEERRAALKALAQEQSQDPNRRKKVNRYYGGSATEFLGNHDSDESGDERDLHGGEEGDARHYAKKSK